LFHTIQVIFIEILGYRIFSVRLVSLIFGALTLFYLYKLSKLILKEDIYSLIPSILMAMDVQFIYASHFARQEAIIPAYGRGLVSTGIALELPEGYRAKIHSRSGLSLKHGIEAGAGLIDQGYRREIGVILYNHGGEDFCIARGDRIAQIAIERFELPELIEVEDFEDTGRGGFGSTGEGAEHAETTKEGAESL
jgi:deoxyuridine 5'-triphosphate nucleotidohydrolase